MGKGISVNFLANVSSFLRGTKNVTEGLDDVLDTLDDVGRDDAGEKVADSLDTAGDAAKDTARTIDHELDDAARDADKSADKIERSFRDALDSVSRDARTAGDDVGRKMKAGANTAADGMGELKDEARSTARETAASFDGSFESIVDMGQETAANAFAGFGPAGAAAGIAAAAGIGFLYTQWQEQIEETKERYRAMYADMLETQSSALSESFVIEQFHGIMQGADDAVISLKELARVAEATGATQHDVALAYAGDAEAAADLRAKLTERIEAETRAAGELAATGVDVLDGYGALIADLDRMRGGLDAQTGAQEKAATAVQTGTEYLRAHGYGLTDTGAAAREYAEALAGTDDAVTAARDAIAANTDALGDNAAQLRTENLGALSTLAGELVGVQEAARTAGADTGELTALQAAQADQFVDTAAAAGIGRDAALDLAHELGLIPADVTTAIAETGSADVIRQAQAIAREADTAARRRTVQFDLVAPKPSDVQAEVNAIFRALVPPSVSYTLRGGVMAP